MNDKSSIVYQFIVLFAIVALDAYILVRTGEINEILTGALIGVMTGIGMAKADKIK